MKHGDVHERARALLPASWMGAIPESDALWLAGHLQECGACNAMWSAQQITIRTLKTLPVNTPSFLASRTKARVHARIREMEENSQRVHLLAISCVLALGATIATVPVAGRLFDWASGMGTTGFLFTWAVALFWFWGAPALAGAALLLTHRNGQPKAFRSAMTRRFGHE